MKLVPTIEQQNIINTAKTGANLAVHAGAGTSKTTSCILIAENVKKQTLYLAFTVANKKEAQERFSHLPHVEVNNWHSLAWNAIVKGTEWSKGRGKDSKCIGYWDVKGDITNIIDDEGVDAWEICELLKEFCKSSEISLGGFCCDWVCSKYPEQANNKDVNGWFSIANKVWQGLINPKNGYKINHDIYLKLYQLSKPNLYAQCEVLILDEGQDTSPVCMDIFLRQEKFGIQLIIVGDEAQAIYGWRGAVNAFDYIPEEGYEYNQTTEISVQTRKLFTNWKHLTLSESFRFGQEIANKANIVLSAMNSNMRLTGRGTKSKIETRATLVRNNSTLFNILLNAADEEKKVEVIADLKDLYSKLWTAFFIRNSAKKEKTDYGLFPDAYVKGFKNWKELFESSEPEARKIVNILSLTDKIKWIENGQELSGLKAAIAKANSAVWENGDKGKPEFVLITAFKAKGLEYDEITLTNDLLPNRKEDEDWEDCLESYIEEQGMNVLYVAITRARVKLNITPELTDFLDSLNT